MLGRQYPCGYNGYDCVKKGTKTCAFFHGLGQDGPNHVDKKFQSQFSTNAQLAPGNKLLQIPFYWGDMVSELEGVCGTVIYNWANTVDFGWDAPEVENSYYEKAQEVVSKGGVVFAHSMGVTIFAGACYKQKKCVSFVALAGPIRGSRAALLDAALIKLGLQPNKQGVKTLANNYPGMMSGPQPNALALSVQKQGIYLAALCGDNALGSGGLAGLGLFAVRDLAYGTFACLAGSQGCKDGWSPVACDGFVHMDECSTATNIPTNTVGGDSFKPTPLARFYRYPGNHQDSTGARGNWAGIFDYIRMQASTKVSQVLTFKP